jgi:putative drug exporter of the RND superfamily
MRTTLGYRLGVLVVHRRRAILAGCAVVLVFCGAFDQSLQGALGPPSYAVEGSQSQQVEHLLERRFPVIGSEDDAIVFYSPHHIAAQSAFRGVIAAAIGVARRERGVRGVLGPYDSNAVGQISSDEHAAVAVVALDGNIRQRYDRARNIQQAVRGMASHGVHVWLTGYSPLAVDLATLSRTDVERAELLGLPVAFVVLLVALGALVAAVVPLLMALAGLVLTYSLLVGLAAVVHLDTFVVSIVTMVGIGLGIDYALFVISRFREELARADRPPDDEGDVVSHALATTLATTGRTVVLSGAVVGISLASLFVVKGPFFREIAVGAVAVVLCMLLMALLLLPALLAELGPKVNRGRLTERLQPANTRSVSHGGSSGRWARAMMRRPVLAAGVAVAVLGGAAVPLLGVHYGLNIGVFSLSSSPSGQGESVLARYFSPGAVAPIQVVVANHGSGTLSKPALAGAQKMVQTLEGDRQVSGVALRKDNGGLLLTVVPAVPIDTPAANHVVAYIRDDLAPPLRAQQHVMVLVGGATAFNVDLEAEVHSKLPVVIAMILGLSLLCLLVVFRSLAIPLKAVLMNLVSTAATLGLVVWVFQDGHAEHLLGFTSPGFIQSYMPLLVFALLFGLSMDYEVFLVRRMQEEWRRTRDNRSAVISGVEHTARPIVAAASIMVVVFGSFVTVDLLEIKQIGFALAVAVAIDATLVRLVLVPAVMCMLGVWNWWLPATLERILPTADFAERGWAAGNASADEGGGSRSEAVALASVAAGAPQRSAAGSLPDRVFATGEPEDAA